MSTFLHGIEIVEVDNVSRPVKTVRSAVIGVVGTADEAHVADSADTEAQEKAAAIQAAFPLNTPVLIAGKLGDDQTLGATGTLPDAVRGILGQAAAMIVAVRVEKSATANSTKNNVLGKPEDRTGIYALLDAESILGVSPRILLAPGNAPNTGDNAIANALLITAERLRAVAILEGPNTTDGDAVAYATDKVAHDDGRGYLIDPFVNVWDSEAINSETGEKGAVVAKSSAPYVAGIIAKVDAERGFWHSPSNSQILGISGTTRPIDYAQGNISSRANYLNGGNVATIINNKGYRLWGNRTTSGDAKWQFLPVVRTADIIHESLLRAHQWAVDRAITRGYVEQVQASVQGYLDSLISRGAILGGECWFDRESNPDNDLKSGQVKFGFDFTPPYPAERITFQSVLTDDYLSSLFGG